MIRNAHNDLQLMRMATGIEEKPIELCESQCERLLELAMQHRFEARAWKTLSEQISRASDKSRNAFIERIECIISQKRRQRSALESISNLAPSVEIVLLKNCRQFFLNGASDNVRWSADVDVVVSEPHRFRLALEKAGIRDEESNLPPHEFMNFRYDGVAMDCHRHLPTLRPIEALTSSVQLGRVETGNICFGSIIENAVSVEFSSSSSVFVPGSEMSCMLLMASMYRDFICSNVPGQRSIVPVRFGSLMELSDALTAPGFDFSKLLELIREHDVKTSAVFCAKLLSDFLDNQELSLHLLPRNSFQPSPTRHFRTLSFGVWYSIPCSGDDFLSKHPQTKELARLLTSKFPCTKDSNKIEFGLIPIKGPNHSTNSIVVVKFSLANEGTVISVALPDIQENFRISVENGSFGFLVIILNGSDPSIIIPKNLEGQAKILSYRNSILEIEYSVEGEAESDGELITVTEFGENVYDCRKIGVAYLGNKIPLV